MPRRILDFDIDAAAEDYARGMSLRELADRYGPSAPYIHKRLIAHGVEMRPAGRRKGTVPVKFARPAAAALRGAGYTYREIAELLGGVSHVAVFNAVRSVPVNLDAKRILQMARG
jgi:hypothetical protein